jgi:hypothetical protein
MLRSTTVAVVVLCLACAGAQPASAQMFSLWGDDIMCLGWVEAAAPFMPFHIFVFLDPGPGGAISCEFKLVTPPGHFATDVTPAPFIPDETIASWYGPPGVSVPFLSCQTETVWIVDLTMMASDITPAYYTLAPHDDSSFLGIATCATGYPPAAGTIYNYFGYNEDIGYLGPGCPNAVEASSWGAVKELYR